MLRNSYLLRDTCSQAKFSFRHPRTRTGAQTDANSTPLEGPRTPLQQPYSTMFQGDEEARGARRSGRRSGPIVWKHSCELSLKLFQKLEHTCLPPCTKLYRGIGSHLRQVSRGRAGR